MNVCVCVCVCIIEASYWRTGQLVKAHVMLACTNGVLPGHLPVIEASNYGC